MTKKKPPSEHKLSGRPLTRIIKLDATPEQAARVFFSHVKPADPSRRLHNRKRKRAWRK